MAVSIAQDLHPASGEEDWGYRSVDYAPERPHAAP